MADVVMRVRCVRCKVTRAVNVERQGDVVVVPARLIHVVCGDAMKVVSGGMKQFMAGTKNDL